MRTANARLRPWLFHGGMGLLAALWLLPLALVLVTSLRTFDDLAAKGLASLPAGLTLEPYGQALANGELRAVGNSLLITVPVVVATLVLASMAAYGLARYRIPFRRTLLLLMLAGNLLPAQLLLIPVLKLTERFGVFDSRIGMIVVLTAVGLGFYTFVLHGFMRGIPQEVTQAARIDGASAAGVYLRIVLPLTKPAMAALGSLAFTWTFNDLLWAITLLRDETKLPVTPAILGMQGQYFSSWNVIAAATVVAAVPTVVVFLRFQRYFISGLLIGSSR
ncbi:carbohydrate ABC transporter permease [Microbispora corallina]|uniref:ABC transporter permease n=1 Tax=Microbispora corallina TaxID=83302 RepID=A0ABQ4FYA5_9ACTN|nr:MULTISPECIES: carbohydrate ABC transporter permease [Microbispora]ETK37004.1 ABC transporter permease [Microbispora sp. ATCC PTA-5024]GIH39797.1 ABC transporter permease [Microbispora corallina]